MSSKTQYKDALKIGNRVMHKLKATVDEQRETIKTQAAEIRTLRLALKLSAKRWWQFWKYE